MKIKGGQSALFRLFYTQIGMNIEIWFFGHTVFLFLSTVLASFESVITDLKPFQALLVSAEENRFYSREN